MGVSRHEAGVVELAVGPEWPTFAGPQGANRDK